MKLWRSSWPRAAILLLFLAPASAPARALPRFTKFAGVLESQPISEEAVLVYWDQAAADAIGLPNPAGRVESPALQAWAKKSFGFEVRAQERTVRKKEWNAGPASPEGKPYLFVEKDASGGAGRAAYLQVLENIWVNLKGVGITGFGRTWFLNRGPPAAQFSSHKDGSLTLEEAIREALYARLADNELSHGASRVIGILTTGRMLTYPDGREAPEALLIRGPLARADQQRDLAAIMDALAEANARRLLKGDLVNPSNIGEAGQLVDFGCITHTCDYVPAVSSQKGKFLHEQEANLWATKLDKERYFLEQLGLHLTNQMGIPEPQLEEVGRTNFALLAESFRALVDLAPEVTIDFAPPAEEGLRHGARIADWLPAIAYEFFSRAGLEREDFVKLMQEKQGPPETPAGLSPEQAGALLAKMRKESDEFFGSAFDIFRRVESTQDLGDRAAYAEAIRRVAEFKLRALPALLRPNSFAAIAETVAAFRGSKNPSLIQGWIDSTITNNRLSAGVVADSTMMLEADAKEARIYVRAALDEQGAISLFSHPEFKESPEERAFFFRLSTDDWNSHRDYAARLVENERGLYFEIRVPHGDGLPVTAEPLRAVPFTKDGQGAVHWPAPETFSLQGPPLFLNERLGLPPDRFFEPDAMFINHGVHVRPVTPAGLRKNPPARRADCPSFFSELFSRMLR